MAQNVSFFFDGERKVFVGSAANRTTALAAENPGARFQEMGGHLFESDGAVWNTVGIGGSGLVHAGLAGAGHTRRLTSLAVTYARATNGADFTEAGGVREVYITILPDAAWTNEKKAVFTYGAESEAIATAWFLDPTAPPTEEVQQIPLQLGVRCGPFTFSENINWIDIKTDVVGDAIVEGVTP